MIDPQSEVWVIVAAKLATMRKEAVQALISPVMSNRDTNFYRGVVAAVDELAELSRPPEAPVDADPAAPY